MLSIGFKRGKIHLFSITVTLKWIFKRLLTCCLFVQYLKVVFGFLVTVQPQGHYNKLIFRKVKPEVLDAAF